ncbi:VWA domain-containing protein [Nocardia sp. NBC_01377]|uniref:vWA domain-containing protein n=1 Tax=Nocardia sp. NBC_01377 TaxID=2903595 RepID=UPI00324D9F8B
MSSEEPATILIAAATAAAPVAAMVRDVFAVLGRISHTQAVANLTATFTDNHLNSLNLDPKQYAAYERTVVEEALSSVFDRARLPARTPLANGHDAHWPPACFTREPGRVPPIACAGCDGQPALRFARVERALQSALQAETSTPPLSDGARHDVDWFLDRLPSILPELSRRGWIDGPCSYESLFTAEYLDKGVADLEAAFRTVSAPQLRRFFDLPYWTQRWQIYEIWILFMVLDSYDIEQWSPITTGGVWDIKAGSTNPKAVSVCDLKQGRQLRCYYQHQSTPPASLIADAEDRPEILVTIADHADSAAAPGASTEQIILAVEAKARSNYKIQDMKGATLSLLEWEPRCALGASFYSLKTGIDTLDTKVIGSTETALAQHLQPGSRSISLTTAWLKKCWSDHVIGSVGIVAVDVSGSMAPGAALQYILTMTNSELFPDTADGLGPMKIYLTTFGEENPTLVRLPALTQDAINSAGLSLVPATPGENLSVAVEVWLQYIKTLPNFADRIDIHLITDKQPFRSVDRDALNQLRDCEIRVHTHIV